MEERRTAADLWPFSTGAPHWSAGRPTLLITADGITLLPEGRRVAATVPDSTNQFTFSFLAVLIFTSVSNVT